MIILVEANNNDRTQHLLIMKASERIYTRSIFHIVKATCNLTAVNIMLNNKNLEVFLLKPGARQGSLLSLSLFNTVLII